MILYHGSNMIVREPRILEPNRTLDYGSGFYTTCAEKQAFDWAFKKLKTPNQCNYVNVYELVETALKDLKVLWFDSPTDEWIDFVMRNRQDETFRHDNDLVYGPVANDNVYVQFGLYEQGFISKATLLAELKVYKLSDQMLFHTERALHYLRFIEAKEVRK